MQTLRISMAVVATSALLLSSLPAATASDTVNTVTGSESTSEAPQTKSDSLDIETVSGIGEFLEDQLQAVEDSTWGEKVTPQKFSERQFPVLMPRSAKQLTSMSAENLGVHEETIDVVNVNSSEVAVENSEVISETPDGTKVEYKVRFTRDIAELPANEDWSELIPYELTIDHSGKIRNIVAKDDEYLAAQFATQELPAEEEEIEVDPTVPGSEDDSGALINPLPPNLGEMATAKLSASSKTKVANYAIKWAKSYNPAYRKYSNDCTNFVSQALYAGGWKEIQGYYKSDAKWFGNGVMTSWTWSGAENFYRFARNESKRASRLASVYSLVPGDVLQYKAQGAKNMTHTMVTTKKINGVPYLSYHTNNTLNKPFTQMKTLNVTWFAHRI